MELSTNSLLLMLVIGIFAFLHYYHAGFVKLEAAGVLALGFAVGAYFGGRLVTSGVVPEKTLRVLFGFLLAYLAAQMMFRSDRRTWAATVTTVMVAAYGVAYVSMRLLGRRLEKEFSVRDDVMSRIEEPVAPDYEI